MNIDVRPEDRVPSQFVDWPLPIDRVLYEAEQPIVFLTHSTSGQSLLAYLAHESDSEIDYILASASTRKIHQLEQGAVGVREALFADWIWLLRRETHADTFDVWAITEAAVPDEYLPVPGTGLVPEHSVVFAARALGDGIALGRMPCSVISLVADSARASLKAVFDFVREANTEGRPTDAQRALYDLPVQHLRFASFEVGLAEPNPVQHAVQRIENFARGGSERDFGAAKDAFEQYKRLAGEAEARAVQARLKLTPEQRRAIFPEDSYDVPLNSLIFRSY